MGLFSDIGDFVSDIFDGAINVVDKVTGGLLSDLLDNDWVKGALMAVSVVTGGIAIANGVMAAGQAGIGEAVKQFASNMSLETGKSLVSSVINGAKQFIGGVAEGIMSPWKSDAGQSLRGLLGDATGNITGTPTTSQGQLAQSSAGDTALQAAKNEAATGVADVANIGQEIGEPLGANFGDASGNMLSDEAIKASQSQSPSLMDLKQTQAVPEVASTPSAAGGEFSTPGYTQVDDLAAAGNFNMPAGGASNYGMSFGGPAGNIMNTGTPGILSRLKNGLVDFAASPQGMYTLANMASGWAQGEQMEKMLKRREAENQRVARSWTDFDRGKYINAPRGSRRPNEIVPWNNPVTRTV